MWVKAIEKAKATDPDKVIDAPAGTKAPNLAGGTSEMLANHHIIKPVKGCEKRTEGFGENLVAIC